MDDPPPAPHILNYASAHKPAKPVEPRWYRWLLLTGIGLGVLTIVRFLIPILFS